MAKLTRKQVKAVEYALRNAERALAYIMAPDVAIARKGGQATTTLHYTRADGSTLYEVTKECGSDLTGLQNCIQELRLFLTGPQIETS
jgi:hypothetical protein